MGLTMIPMVAGALVAAGACLLVLRRQQAVLDNLFDMACALVADNHRGMISVDSEPGKGATVTIRLPLDAESASAANA